jgi:hypothetical protein
VKTEKAAEQEEGDNRQYVLSLLDEYQKGELAHMVGKEETKVERNSSHFWRSVDRSRYLANVHETRYQHRDSWRQPSSPCVTRRHHVSYRVSRHLYQGLRGYSGFGEQHAPWSHGGINWSLVFIHIQILGWWE